MGPFPKKSYTGKEFWNHTKGTLSGCFNFKGNTATNKERQKKGVVVDDFLTLSSYEESLLNKYKGLITEYTSDQAYERLLNEGNNEYAVKFVIERAEREQIRAERAEREEMRDEREQIRDETERETAETERIRERCIQWEEEAIKWKEETIKWEENSPPPFTDPQISYLEATLGPDLSINDEPFIRLLGADEIKTRDELFSQISMRYETKVSEKYLATVYKIYFSWPTKSEDVIYRNDNPSGSQSYSLKYKEMNLHLIPMGNDELNGYLEDFNQIASSVFSNASLETLQKMAGSIFKKLDEYPGKKENRLSLTIRERIL